MRNCFHTSVITLVVFGLIFLVIPNAQAQIFDKETREKIKQADRSEFKYIPKKPGHYSTDDWRAAIDSTWGQGMTTVKKIQLFEFCWNRVDDTYPGFFNIADNWDELYTLYHSEVVSGVSRGRFYAIMSHMFSNLTDLHSGVMDVAVSTDSLKPGVPLFVPMGVYSFFRSLNLGDFNHHFGASLSPLPDSTVFVYDVIPDHPLGLQPGDIILGYDGIPWKYLYQELIQAGLPIAGGGTYGSNPKSSLHGILTSAGENWHLFDTIDILKYSTGETQHLPTSLLSNQQMDLLTTEQLPVPGVSFPDIENGHLVSWGIIDGTQTGYIYTWAWTTSDMIPGTYNAGDEFLAALQTLVNDFSIDGLIIDSRCNMGGWVPQYIQCLNFLFGENDQAYRGYYRNNPDDHYTMTQWNIINLNLNATQYLFDKPIALLTGPFSISCGDFMPLHLRRHPMVRSFGLGTNGAFGNTSGVDISSITNEWSFIMTGSNFQLAEQPGLFLTHLYIPPDEEIWFTQEDVVQHEDNVVRRALEWIGQMIYAHDVTINKAYLSPVTDSLHITAQVTNPDQHNVNIAAIINNIEDVRVDSIPMFDDGLHHDGPAGDGYYGTYAVLDSEKVYKVCISTADMDSAHYHILPNAKRFTTVGPLVFAGLVFQGDTIVAQNERVYAKIDLQNLGSTEEAQNISVALTTRDSAVFIYNPNISAYNSIAAGATVSSSRSFGFQCLESGPRQLKIDIMSDGYVFWSDSFIVNVVSGLEHSEEPLPMQFALKQNYPNPFNPETTIEFQIPSAQFVTLKVYNMLGQEVATLVSKKLTAGNYTYTWDATNFASGVYIYTLETRNGYKQRKKLLLLK